VREPWPLPSDWRWSEWKDVARVASNLVNPADFQDHPHIAPNHIESGTGRLLPYQTVRDDGVTSSKHLFKPGQLLYSKIRPYLAKAVVVDFGGLCSADMYPVDTELDHRYLKWWMLSPDFTRFAAGEQARTVLPKINKDALGRLPVPVPPLAEQHRIVDLLEDHLSRLDAADAYLDACKRRLDALQRAVLADIYAGPTQTLASLASASGYGTSVKCVEDGPGDAVVRIPNLVDGRIDLTDEKRVADAAVDVSSMKLRHGDLLIVRTNGSVDLIGRSAVVQHGIDAAFASYLIRYRLRPDVVRPEWVQAMLSAPQTRRRIESLAASSAGQYNLSLAKLDPLKLPVPSLDAQDAGLARLHDARDHIGRLRATALVADKRRAGLRRSLLAAAFSGRLTTDPSDVSEAEATVAV
jgi:type I restriction enzyme S subunit